MKRHTLVLVISSVLCLGLQTIFASSATWTLNPTSNDWNTAENWTPPTIPSSETDVATFAASNTTNPMCGDAPGGGGTTTIVGDIVFAEGASPYTITVTPVFDNIYPSILELHGGGITNNSRAVQNFVTADSGTTKASARMYFMKSASAGENTIITNEGGASATGDGMYGAFTQFWDTSTAGKATFVNNGGTVNGAGHGGVDLLFSSSAESARFINNPGTVSGAFAAYTLVQTLGEIGDSTFIGNPANVDGAEGGWVEIDGGTAAGANFIANGATTAGPQAGQIYVYGGGGYATFTGNGGEGSGADGGLIDLFALPFSDPTFVIAKGGTDGGAGGKILVEGEAVVDIGRFQVFGNGLLDLTPVTKRRVTIGSLEGDGVVSLAGHSLNVGSNDLSTTFVGTIQDAGSLSKLGAGTVTLSGANTYSGGTTVSAGELKVSNRTGSGTGTGAVNVNAGTLSGKGIISGAVTIGTGSGAGAFLAPGQGATKVITLTIQSPLTFKADGTYTYRLKTKRAEADKVIANGVTIESGAQFSFKQLANKQLTAGTVFTAISNTSANPIAGTFANLPDDSAFTAGNNTYQANYQSGDGNDLTLTVVP